MGYLGKSVDTLRYTIKKINIDGIDINNEFHSLNELEAFLLGFCYGFNYTEIKKEMTKKR